MTGRQPAAGAAPAGPRARPAGRGEGVVSASLAAAVFLAAFLAPQAMPVLGVLAVLAVIAARPPGRRLPAVPLGIAAWIAAFLGWGLLTMAWSIDAQDSLKKAGQIAATAAVALVLAGAAADMPDALRRRVRAVVFAAGWALVVATAAEGHLGMPYYNALAALGLRGAPQPFDLNRTVLLVVILSWVAAHAGWLAGRRKAALLLPAAATLAALGLHSGTAGLAALAGVAVAAFAAAVPGVGARVYAAAFAVAACAVLAVAPALGGVLDGLGLPPSLLHRFFIWDFAGDRILERPVLGWGLDAARSMPNFGVVPFTGDPTDSVIPLHPHNAYVQVTLETGAVGFAMLLGLIAALFVAAGRRDRVERPWLYGLLTAVSAAGITGYGAWQSWWIAGLGLAAFLAIATGRAPAAYGGDGDKAAYGGDGDKGAYGGDGGKGAYGGGGARPPPA